MLKNLINNYAFEKNKHLELYDSFLNIAKFFQIVFRYLKHLDRPEVYFVKHSIVHSRVANSRPDYYCKNHFFSQNITVVEKFFKSSQKILGSATKRDLLLVATYRINFIKILLQNHMVKREMNIFIKPNMLQNSAQWANNRSWFVGSMPQCSSSVKLFSTIWSPRSNASNGGRISNHHRPWNILFWFVCPLQLLRISLIYTCGVCGCLVAKCGKLSLTGISLYVKVRQSRKQFMVSSILPRNERNALRIPSWVHFVPFGIIFWVDRKCCYLNL